MIQVGQINGWTESPDESGNNSAPAGTPESGLSPSGPPAGTPISGPGLIPVTIDTPEFLQMDNGPGYVTGNNPVKYLDPDGRASIDGEEKVIFADLDNLDDLNEAANMLSHLQTDGYTVIATNENGYGFGFSNYGDMLSFLESNDPTTTDWGQVGDILTYTSMAVNVAGMVSLFVAPAAAPGLFAVSAGLDLLAAASYAADGDYQSAAFSAVSGTLGVFLPSPGYKTATGRFTRPGRSLFMKTNTARLIFGSKAFISPSLFGTDMAVEKLRR